jgi:hypothetical protein
VKGSEEYRKQSNGAGRKPVAAFAPEVLSAKKEAFFGIEKALWFGDK